MIKIIYKSFVLSIISLLFISLSATAVANNKNPKFINSPLKTTPDDTSKHKFSLGLELFPYSYKEPDLMKMNGFFYGINGSYSFYLGKYYFLQLESRAALGKTNYSSNGTGSHGTKTTNKLLETRVLFNRYFQVSSNIYIYPFIGLGFRYKEDNSNGIKTTTGHTGVLRESNYYYVPVGLSMHYNLQQGWGLYISGEYDIFLEGKQKTSGSLSSNTFKVINNQSKGYGLRSEILLEKTFNKYIVSIGPYINYWNIKDSDTDRIFCRSCGAYHYFYEPKNITQETGIKIKLTF